MRKTKFQSLSGLFDAPQGYSGYFGVITGFSADQATLQIMAERFSGLMPYGLSQQGKVYLSLFLDFGASPIQGVPGVCHHLPTRDSIAASPFALMHAKVALLLYRRDNFDEESWLIRLVVSSGNWTTQSTASSLDVAWFADYPLSGDDSSQFTGRNVISDAWEFMRRLQSHYDMRLVSPKDHGATNETQSCFEQFTQVLNRVTAKRVDTTPFRFIDSWNKSLVDEMTEAIADVAPNTKFRQVILGSAFYEGAPSDGKAIPFQSTVPYKVYQRLKDQKLIYANTAPPTLVANLQACQALPSWSKRPAVIAPYDASGFQRVFMHAKFLYLGDSLNDATISKKNVVYLGSGNFTKPGMMMSTRVGGNLEVGIVFPVENLDLSREKQERFIGNFLPFKGNKAKAEAIEALAPGQSEFAPYNPVPAPPIYAYSVKKTDGRTYLVPLPVCCADVVIKNLGSRMTAVEDRILLNADADIPGSVQIEYLANTYEIPVIDEFGRIGAAKLPPIDMASAFDYLAGFPFTPEPEYDDVESSQITMSVAPILQTAQQSGSYHLRTVMQLVERIADKQSQLRDCDWTAWCSRLAQILIAIANDSSIAYARRIGIDPLEFLREEAFRPAFAETDETPQGQAYEAALDKVKNSWDEITV